MNTTMIFLAHVSSQAHIHPRDVTVIIIGLIILDCLVGLNMIWNKIRNK